jgi:lipoyl(octanoyl) transferase
VGDAKIAALGLKIRNGCCYHGLSLNVAMDMTPFTYINPCGFQGLRVAQLRDLGIRNSISDIEKQLAEKLVRNLVLHQESFSTESA